MGMYRRRINHSGLRPERRDGMRSSGVQVHVDDVEPGKRLQSLNRELTLRSMGSILAVRPPTGSETGLERSLSFGSSLDRFRQETKSPLTLVQFIEMEPS